MTRSRHLSSFMLGLMALAWAPIPFLSPSNFRMVQFAHGYSLKWIWLGYLLVVAFLLMYGSQQPCRRMRLIGLGLSAVMWFSFCMIYLKDMVYSPSMMTMLICGVMSVITLISDVRRKPRVACKSMDH
jgi:FtsH-binding integral membrane protein